MLEQRGTDQDIDDPVAVRKGGDGMFRTGRKDQKV